MDKHYKRFSICFIVICMLLFGVFFIRFFSKIILVNKLHYNSSLLQYVADYTLGDWVDVIEPKDWSTPNNSEEYRYYQEVYKGMNQILLNQTAVNNNETDIFSALSLIKKIELKIKAVENDIEKYTNEKYAAAKGIKKIRQYYQRKIFGGMVYARNEGEEFDLLNGYTWIATEYNIVPRIEDKNVAVSRYLKKCGRDYLVIRFPSRISSSKAEVPVGAAENSNENTAAEVQKLNNLGVECYNVSNDLNNAGWNTQNGYFQTDPHWTAESGLMSAKLIAEYLNENHDFHFDLSLLEETEYTKETFKLDNYGNKERVTIPFPDFPTSVTFRNIEGGYEYVGDFRNAIFDDSMIDSQYKKEVLDIYSGCRIRNTKFGMIQTKSSNNDKVILFDISSMSWYIVSYLSLQCDKVYFTTGPTVEQLEYLIDVLNPDMVISM